MAGERPVTVRIRSRQVLDGEESRLEQQATGTLSGTAGGWVLRYREPAPERGENRLTLEGGEAVLERRGGLETRMRFQPGAAHPARYQTPYGALDLLVSTEYLGHSLSHSGGQVLIRYRLSAGGQPVGAYTLQLQVRGADIPAEQKK